MRCTTSSGTFISYRGSQLSGRPCDLAIPPSKLLRKALLLSCSTGDQFTAVVVEYVSTLEHSLSNQSTASALRSLAAEKAPKPSQQKALRLASGPTWVAPVGAPMDMAPKVVNLTPSLLSLRRLTPKTERGEGGEEKS